MLGTDRIQGRALIAPVQKLLHRRFQNPLAWQGVPYDKEMSAYWLTKSAEQGNEYAESLLESQDSIAPPSVFLSVTRLLHPTSRVFRENSLPQ